MKIKYEFVTGEVVEIEVDEELGGTIIELERDEYNRNRKETRRHESYSDDSFKKEILVDKSVDIEAEIEMNMEYEQFHRAITLLQPQQQELVNKLFYKKRTMADIAREEKVSSKAIQARVNKIKIQIRKIIENNLL